MMQRMAGAGRNPLRLSICGAAADLVTMLCRICKMYHPSLSPNVPELPFYPARACRHVLSNTALFALTASKSWIRINSRELLRIFRYPGFARLQRTGNEIRHLWTDRKFFVGQWARHHLAWIV
jgi:hypothetical protein